MIILTTVTLASSNNTLPDGGNCTKRCRSCFNVNFNILFKAILLCISWYIKNSDNIKIKAAFNKKRALFTSTLDLELRKKLVKCFIWSIALYGAETWTLRAIDQKHLESFEMWCWRRMEKISWTDHVRTEEVLLRVKEQRNILHEISKRKAN